MNRDKIYFVSDAHLGSKFHADSRESERKLCRWLDLVKADAKTVYLLGDMFDYWFEYRHVVPRGFTRFLGKLSELSDAGVEVNFFTGNHDIWVSDYLQAECGVRVFRQPLVKDFNGKKFFLAHGDGLGDKSLSFRFLRSIFHNRFLQKAFAGIHPRWTIPLAHTWSNHSRLNGGVADYLGEDQEHLLLFAKKQLEVAPNINYFIFGHRHIMLDLPVAAQSRVIILGDWIRYFSYAVFDGADVKPLQFEE
ncbi:MAG: UDP-2,3-diacylglucosamine diphosphatase [Dysgonamonadaceae bacterium]|jgi:UDP-2,3-diacylglucosamine hydrolase|nr:UDP-2,3-diacylglucosamine diphosphatase [Dysgonamonadaceae bacterium]